MRTPRIPRTTLSTSLIAWSGTAPTASERRGERSRATRRSWPAPSRRRWRIRSGWAMLSTASARPGCGTSIRYSAAPTGDVFERLGPFDEDLLRSQDSELTFRVLRAGGRVLLVPGVVATYYARAALGKLWRMFFQYGYFKPLVARKVGAVMTARQLVPALFVFTVGLATLVAPWFRPARLLLVLTLGAYVAADLIVALILARRREMPVGLASSAVFPVVHFAHGSGYLLGTWDFVIRRRRGAPSVALTR